VQESRPAIANRLRTLRFPVARLGHIPTKS
jgi:hypothetical protein